MNEINVPTKSVRLIGYSLLILGCFGFLYFRLTSDRIIDANFFTFPFIALMGWFITQLKSWARKSIIAFFVLALVFDVVGMSLSILDSFDGKRFLLDVGWFAIHGTFVVLLMKKPIKTQFIN